MGLTTGERVQAVVDYGFTEREARFLVLVTRHGGLCVKRQYAAFAGIANGGDRCNALFDSSPAVDSRSASIAFITARGCHDDYLYGRPRE